MQERQFTIAELSQYNGKSGAPALIAYHGLVYDVSASFLWQNGSHWVLHGAGADLTDELVDAPHSAELLKRFPVVGILHHADV